MTSPGGSHDGEGWLETLPAGWTRLRLKYVTNFVNGAAFKPEEWADAGTPIVRIENLNGSDDFNYTRRQVPEKYHVYKDELLFGWSGNIGTSFGPFWWSRTGTHYLNQHIFKVTGFDADKRWLYWVLRAVTFEVETRVHGIIGLVHVTRPELDNTLVPVPARGQQRDIANFLDRKTASIDALVAKQEQLLVLLAEKRQAFITQAVTKGLDPNVPMKDSGLEWIGAVPHHWSVKKLGLLLRGIEQGWSPDCIGRSPEPGEWGVLKAGAVNTGELDEMESKALPHDLVPIPRLEVHPGDVLMSRASGSPLWLGAVGIVRHPVRRLLLCDKLYRLAIDRTKLDPEYAVLVLRSPPVRALIDAAATGQSTLRNIGQAFVRGILFAWPPLDEQERIVDHVRTELRRLDALAERAQAMIDKLREYRQALITAAVTGKLDVSKEPA